MARITLTLDKALSDRLKACAAADGGRSRSSVVRLALKARLKALNAPLSLPPPSNTTAATTSSPRERKTSDC